ncbi:hypothetical protein CIHG_05528 [Coccidioides immitis H538.4]|uniref:Uncharacterized protein n=1 Tax=Coccidioides immitis H538.4 TaxID=396776 RepID=A0A0J8RUM8_COCIT|nr:hypothetical protein CIHG_05528 [Coccidioides immitis H538.4]
MHPVGPNEDDAESGTKQGRSHFARRQKDTPPKRKQSLDSVAPRKRRLSVEFDGAFTIEDISNQDSGYDADLEVVWPYQYEDGGEEAEPGSKQPTNSKWTGPKRINHDDVSHSKLIDWMRSLRCDSENDTARLKKRRKRKSRPSLDSLHQRSSLRSGHPSLNRQESKKALLMAKRPKMEYSGFETDTDLDLDPINRFSDGPFISEASAHWNHEKHESSAVGSDSMDID